MKLNLYIEMSYRSFTYKCMKIYCKTMGNKAPWLLQRSTDDPFSIGKLFEFLRDRYTEQIEKRATKPRKVSQDATELFVWPCSVLRHLRNEFFTIEKGLFGGR